MSDSDDTSPSSPWPTNLTLSKQKDLLTITFDSNETFQFSAEFLRVYSPSAEVKGHGAEPRKILGGKKDVQILNIEPVGNYAVKLVFDDMHNTGIYSWVYFYELGEKKDDYWQTYLEDIEKLNLSREKRGLS